MSKVIIIAGKDQKDFVDFTGGVAVCDRTIVTHEKAPKQDEEPISQEGQSMLCVKWNRASALGARTFLLKAENKFNNIDEAMLIFDEEYFAKQYTTFSTNVIPQAADDMLLGYHYLCQEILNRYEKKFSDNKAKPLVFVLRMRRDKDKTSSFCSVYLAAFEQFAQCIATMYKERPFVNVLLVKVESNNALYNNGSGLAKWICEYLDVGIYPKKSLQWIKAGAKAGMLWDRASFS